MRIDDALSYLEFGDPCSSDFDVALNAVINALKAQEPRILTADEMKAWDKDVWIEDFDEDKVIALDESVAGFAVACMRGKKRCWTARPTEEQRKAVPWE
jgi:hypothetical protein